MKASEVFERLSLTIGYKIVNEQSFDVFMLSESKCDFKACIFIDSEKYINSIPSNVTMVITNEELSRVVVNEERGAIITEEPRLFFFTMHNLLSKTEWYTRKQFCSCIDSTAEISKLAEISQYNVIIEEDVVIEPFVMIYPNVRIRKGSIIRAGAVIGGCGFEFKRNQSGIMGVEHVGGVEVGEYVEIQNNSCIDRAIYPWDNTVLGDNVKIDNLVHVAHGVKIDKNVMVVANSGIGGRVEIHENAWIGFGATIRNGIALGKNSRANMGAVVTKNVGDDQAVSGNFAMDHHSFIKNMKKMTGGAITKSKIGSLDLLYITSGSCGKKVA